MAHLETARRRQRLSSSPPPRSSFAVRSTGPFFLAQAIGYCLREVGDVAHVAINQDSRANLIRKPGNLLRNRPDPGWCSRDGAIVVAARGLLNCCKPQPG